MNRTYRVVFNRSLGVPQVVSELVASSGGTVVVDVGARPRRDLRRRLLGVALSAGLLALGVPVDGVLAQSVSAGGHGASDGGVNNAGAGGNGDGMGGGSGQSAGASVSPDGTGGGGTLPNVDNATGGSPGVWSSTASNIVGGTGQAGSWHSLGVNGAGYNQGGGGGGAGALLTIAQETTDKVAVQNQVVIGGMGGAGTNTSGFSSPNTSYYSGGGGGGGGAGLLVAGGVNVEIDGQSQLLGGQGGNGGAGGTSPGGPGYGGGGGGGGGGGDGMYLTSSGVAITNAGSIHGGLGGTGGAASGSYGGGGGGSGGAGVDGANYQLSNTGTIVGGNGGAGGAGSPAGSAGAGGAGVVATGNSTITTSGTIAGGVSGDSTPIQANAVSFSGGGNHLVLQQGYQFTGNVVSTSGTSSGGDTLVLGSGTSQTFSLSDISAGTPTTNSGTTSYYGFSGYEVANGITWTLTGSTSVVTPWTVNGTLIMGAGSSLAPDSTVNLAALNSIFNISTSGNQTIGSLAGVAGGTVVLGGNTLTFGGIDNASFNGSITGPGSLVKNGAGVQTLGGANTYTGGTTINAGTLALGVGASLASTGVVNLATGATLDLSAGNGTQNLTTQSFGTLVGNGWVNLGANVLTLGDATNGTFSGSIIGTGSVVKEGTGTETLTGTNAYTGGTLINAGTLAIGTGGSLASAGGVTVGFSASFDIRGGDQTIGYLTGGGGGSGTVILGTHALTLSGDVSTSYDGIITGAGGLVKSGPGDQGLRGANTFSGGVTLNAGGLSLGNNGALGTGTLSVGGNATLDTSTALNITNDIGLAAGATLDVLGSDALTLDGKITGAGGLTKDGATTLTLTGANTYIGGTTINNGTLALSGAGDLANTSSVNVSSTGVFDVSAANDGVSAGSLSGAGTVNLGSRNLALTAASGDFSGDIGGTAGSLTINGGTQTLSGANDYTGATTIDADATLKLSGGGRIESSSGVSVDGTLDIGSTTAGASVRALSGGTGGRVALGSQTLTVTNASTGFDGIVDGTGGLTIAGGTQTLTGANTYGGATTIDSGATLTLIGGGSIADTSAVKVLGTGHFDIGGVTSGTSISSLSGTGAVSLGSKNLTLTAANGSFSGGIGSNGGGLTIGGGTQTLSGTNDYTGATAINAGATLKLSGAGSIGSSSGVLVDGTLDIGSTNAGASVTTLSGGISGRVMLGDQTLTVSNASTGFDGIVDGTGGLTIASGTQTLTGANTYGGATTIDSGATLALSGSGSVGSSSDIVTHGTFDIGQTIGGTSITSLSGDGTVYLGNQTLTLSNASGTFSGIVSGVGGGLTVAGGTQTLTGANTYTGVTTIDSGATLVVASAQTLASSQQIVNNGTLGYLASNDMSGAIVGSGGLLVASPATVTTALVNTYTGATTIDNGGTLTLTGGGSIAQSSGVADNGLLDITGTTGGASITALTGNGAVRLGNQSLILTNASGSFGGAIEGNGAVTIAGGAQTFGGVNAYIGATNVVRGARLILGAGDSIASSAALHNDGVFDVSGTSGASIKSLSGAGSVVLGDKMLTLTQAADTYGGDIGGRGGLHIVGGTQTLGGTNNYTGTTSIDSGATLALSGAGSIAASSDVATNGTLDLSGTTAGASLMSLSGAGAVHLGNQTLSLTQANGSFGGVIEGTGNVAVSGGTQTLTGTNTYAGTTTIANGSTLVLSGTGSIAASSGVSNSGTLDISATTNGASMQSVSGAGVVSLGDKTLTLTQASGRFDGTVSGAGGLDLTTAGTYALNGNNSYTGGTILSGGTLALGSDRALGTGRLLMAQNTALVLGGDGMNLANAITLTGDPTIQVDGANTNTVSGVLSDGTLPGDLVKTGTGTLVLTADNTYTGGTEVSAGALQLGADGTVGSVQGNVAVDQGATLRFQRSDVSTFAGVLSGTGDVVKAGSGTLTVSGDSSAFAGRTQVNSGVLDVAGSLGGTTTVASGASLVGTGTLGNLVAAGTLSPGGQGVVGTLNVRGNLTMQSGASYLVDAPAGSAGDTIAVTGTASLLGGSVLSFANGSGYSLSTVYPIITANGGVTGTFGSVQSNLAFLVPSLTYDANHVYLTLSRNDVAFASVASTPNQRASASGLQSVGSGALLQDVIGMTATDARASFDRLSGEIHASTQSALLNDSHYVRDAASSHLHGQDAGPVAKDDRGSVWASTWGHWGDLSGNANAASIRNSGGGMVVGSDVSLGEHEAVGVVLGQSESSTTLADRSSDAHAKSTHLGVYGSVGTGGFQLDAGLFAQRSDIDTHRTVTLTGYHDQPGARYHADLQQAFVEGSYRFDIAHGAVSPYLGLARVHMTTDGFTEHGGDAALQASGSNDSLNVASAGVRGDWQLDATGDIAARARLGVEDAWSGTNPSSRLRFASGGDSFVVDGVPLARHTGVVDLGLHWRIAKAVGVDASYLGRFGSGNKDQGARLSVSVGW